MPPLSRSPCGDWRGRRALALQPGERLDRSPPGHQRHHLLRVRVWRQLAAGQEVFRAKNRIVPGQERGLFALLLIDYRSHLDSNVFKEF